MSSSLKEEVKSLFIYDIEMDARECSSKSSILCHKQYKDLKEFQWSDILKELVSRQSTLAEVLLAVALPTGKIGNTKPIEALCPVVGTIYGMLMMQRFHQLSAVQRFITATLANEQTHQKVCNILHFLLISFVVSFL
jgi:putative copper export protein